MRSKAALFGNYLLNIVFSSTATNTAERRLRRYPGQQLRHSSLHRFDLQTKPDGRLLLLLLAFVFDCFRAPVACGQGAPDIVWVATNHVGQVNAAAFSPDGSLLASGGDDATIRVWQTSNGSLLQTLTNHNSSVSSVVFSTTNRLASWSADSTVRLWDLISGALVRTQYLADADNLVFAKDGSLFGATHSNGSTLKIWRVLDGTLQTTIPMQQPYYTLALDFSWQNAIFTSGRAFAEDFEIDFWRVNDGALLRTFRGTSSGGGFLGGLKLARFSQDASILAVTTSGPDITMGPNEFTTWTVPDGRYLGRINQGISNGAVAAIAFCPDGSRLIAARANNGICVFRMPDGTTLRCYDQETANIRSLAVSPDGTLFAYGQADGKVTVARTYQGLFVINARVVGNEVVLQWSGGGGPYQLQRSSSLTWMDWANIGAPTVATSYTNTLGGESGFYRVVTFPN